MRLTAKQQEKVTQNVRLVHKVINDKVYSVNQPGLYSYEDLFQIGCIGLCKAAATDKGGTFSTYAYKLIWHEICDALIYAARRQTAEVICDVLPYSVPAYDSGPEDVTMSIDLHTALQRAIQEALPCVRKGIEAMQMMSYGYTSREIGDQLGASAKLVCAWISKAKKFLRARPEIQALATT